MPSVITHLAVGALVGALFLAVQRRGGWPPLRYPGAIIGMFALAALVPDLDSLTDYHRRLGHNLLSAFVIPSIAATVAAALLADPRHRALALWLPAALATHIWLDLLAPVGGGETPLLFPFVKPDWVPTGQQLAFDWVPVFDHGVFLFAAPFIEAAIAAWHTDVEHTARRLPRYRTTVTIAALVRPLWHVAFIALLGATAMVTPGPQSFS